MSARAYGLFSFGYRFIELFIWGLYVHLIRTRGLSPYWTIALNVGIWTLSRYGGFVIAASVGYGSSRFPVRRTGPRRSRGGGRRA